MKRVLLALVLAAVSACSGAGTDPKVQCPSSDQQLTRDQWEACYGYQDHDSSGGR
jgi:hypothetical protein